MSSTTDDIPSLLYADAVPQPIANTDTTIANTLRCVFIVFLLERVFLFSVPLVLWEKAKREPKRMGFDGLADSQSRHGVPLVFDDRH